MKPALCAGALCLLFVAASQAQESHWRGVPLAPENRCSEYDPDDYPYPQAVELEIIAAQGDTICSPYTRECFASRKETDIEHIVARSEAHDSGLCAADDEVKAEFAADLINLTLASPRLNRYQKVDKDAAEWLPEESRCWFATQILAVRLTYGLTIDPREAAALEEVFSDCAIPEESLPYLITKPTPVNAYACATADFAVVDRVNGYAAVMVIGELPDAAEDDDPCWAEIVLAGALAYLPCAVLAPVEARERWDSITPLPTEEAEPNSYEGLTCAAIYEQYGEANFGPDHPAYNARRDRDKDGIACER